MRNKIVNFRIRYVIFMFDNRYRSIIGHLRYICLVKYCGYYSRRSLIKGGAYSIRKLLGVVSIHKLKLLL